MADNWEDRLAASPVVKDAKKSSNWEDRLQSASYQHIKKPTEYGDTLHFGPFDTGIELSPNVNNFLAGMGKSFVDLGRGVGQKLGMVSTDDIKEAQRLDADLMATKAGNAGNVAGDIVSTAPVALLPGAATLRGALAYGAATGALQPATSAGDFAGNVATGGIAGVGGNVAGRVAGATLGGVKAAAQPFFEKGRQAIEADLIRRFTPNVPDTLRNLTVNGGQYIAGSLPTAAEAAGNTGIAQLSKQVQQMSPGVNQAFAERAAAQNAARVAAIRGIAGDDLARQAAVDARTAASRPLYQQAESAVLPADDTLNTLLSRPSMQSAMGRAQRLAQEAGTPIQLPAAGENMPEQYTGKGLQYLKMGLDDILNTPQAAGIGAHEQGAIKDTRSALTQWLQQNNPAYAQADAKFAELSRPINQMDIGSALANKLIPAINDFGATKNLKATQFAQALRDGDAMAARVLDRPSATMANVMEPEQLSMLDNLGKDLARSQMATELARAPGSDTAQNIASQNIIKSVMGPLGMPEGMAANTLLRTITRPAQWAASLAEPQIMTSLGNTLLSPEATAAALQRAQVPGLADRLAQALLRMGTPAGIAAGQIMAPSVNPAQQ
jgi:hypothetical protein